MLSNLDNPRGTDSHIIGHALSEPAGLIRGMGLSDACAKSIESTDSVPATCATTRRKNSPRDGRSGGERVGARRVVAHARIPRELREMRMFHGIWRGHEANLASQVGASVMSWRGSR